MRYHISPSLILLALAAAPVVHGVEVAKGISLDGYSDTTLTATQVPEKTASVPPTLADRDDTTTDFAAFAKLRLTWHPNERITGKISVLFSNESTSAATLSEGWMATSLDGDLNWTMGKYLSPLGWIGPDPADLYRVNASTIGYNDWYGIDPLGTYVEWAPAETPFTVQVHVTNGFFDTKDNLNDTAIDTTAAPVPATPGATAPELGHRRSDLGLALDLAFHPTDQTVFNLEVGWDPSSSTHRSIIVQDSTGTDVFSELPRGDVTQVGFNATIKSGETWTFGGEVLHRWSVAANEDAITGEWSTGRDLLWLLMANAKLPEFAGPCSATAMFQQVRQNWGSDFHTPAINEFSAALLTNPFATDRLGVNLEIAHSTVQDENRSLEHQGVTTLAVEVLVQMP